MANKHISTLPNIEPKENNSIPSNIKSLYADSSLRTHESDKSATSNVQVFDTFKNNMFNET